MILSRYNLIYGEIDFCLPLFYCATPDSAMLMWRVAAAKFL